MKFEIYTKSDNRKFPLTLAECNRTNCTEQCLYGKISDINMINCTHRQFLIEFSLKTERGIDCE